jgi:hypothetical protein
VAWVGGGMVGEVGGDADVKVRLREVHAADRVALETWWTARSAVTDATERCDSARRADRLEQRRMLGGMTDRQRTWTGHALDEESARRVTPSARAHLRRMVWARSRLAAVDARPQDGELLDQTPLADAARLLAEATRALLIQMPWAAELTGLTSRDLRRLTRGTS